MVVNCEQVWQEISNYLDGEVGPELRAAMEIHFRECRHCTSVLNGTRNIVHLYADERLLKLPASFTAGWQSRVEESNPSPRRTVYGWLLAAAAVGLISGSLGLARLDAHALFTMRSYHAQPGAGIPDEMMVAISADGKTFHIPGCRYLHKHEHENVRLVAAAEAIREGYVPCIRCLREYLKR